MGTHRHIKENPLFSMIGGGEGGIRTHGGRKPTPVFETGAIDHSATSPRFGGRLGRGFSGVAGRLQPPFGIFFHGSVMQRLGKAAHRA